MTTNPDDVAAVLAVADRRGVSLQYRGTTEEIITALDAARAKRLPKEVAAMIHDLKEEDNPLCHDVADLLVSLSAEVEDWHQQAAGLSADLTAQGQQLDAANIRAKKAEAELRLERQPPVVDG